MTLFTAAALAQAAPAGAGNPIMQFLPFVLIFVVFYFLMIRPQQQARKKHKEMVAAVRRGDTVVTQGGLVGKVTKVTEGADEIMVELADGVQVKVIKTTLADVRSKTEPAEKKSDTKDDQ